MINFDFPSCTAVSFGKGQVIKLKDIAPQYGKKYLLVYGGGSIKRSGLYDQVMEILKDAGITVTELSGVNSNPKISSVREGIELCRENQVEALLAVGGGSCIDCAKTVAAGVAYDGDPWDLVTDPSKITSVLPVLAVSTLSATGSEMDPVAVIKNDELHKKQVYGHPALRPKFSVLDPSLTYSVPQRYTAAGTADIIAHTLENYLNDLSGDTYFQDSIQETIMKTCIKYGPIACKDPENYDARANLMWASCWSINGFGRSGKAGGMSVHPIEEQLCSFYNNIHGEGLAILTPSWMRLVLNEKNAHIFEKFALHVFEIKPGATAMETAKKGIDALQTFYTKDLGIPATLSEIGVESDEHFREMAKMALATPLNGAGYELTEEDVYNIYKNAL